GNNTDTTVDLHFEVTAKLELAEEADIDWVLGVRVQGVGVRQQVLANGHTYQVPHNTTYTFAIADTQRPTGLGPGDEWRTYWTQTVAKKDILVDDNDQYLFWVQLSPDVQIHPTREIFTSVREDID